MPQLKAEVEDLKHSIALQCSVHQVKVEGLRVAHKLEVEQQRNAHLGELELKTLLISSRSSSCVACIQWS